MADDGDLRDGTESGTIVTWRHDGWLVGFVVTMWTYVCGTIVLMRCAVVVRAERGRWGEEAVESCCLE